MYFLKLQFLWVQGTQLLSSQLSWQTVDTEPVFYYLLLLSLWTLTTFLVIKVTHFSCLGFPMFTSMFKVKVTNVIFYSCNRKRIKLSYCFGSHNALYEKWRKVNLVVLKWNTVEFPLHHDLFYYYSQTQKFWFSYFDSCCSLLLEWWHLLAIILRLVAGKTQGTFAFLNFYPAEFCHKLPGQRRHNSL